MAQTKVIIYEWQDGHCLGLWVDDQFVESDPTDSAETLARLCTGLGAVVERRIVTGHTMHISSEEEPA